MCRYKKWEKTILNEFRAEGNHGGDYIKIQTIQSDGSPLQDGMIILEVGHCCVVYIKAIVPVEFITSILANSLDIHANLGDVMRANWNTNYGKVLADKIVNL